MNRYRIDNWSDYNTALIQRGSLTIWIDDDAMDSWMAHQAPCRRGRPQVYSDEAVLLLLILRERFHLPLRALQGFAASIFLLMGVDLPVPSYSQVCRRAKQLNKTLPRCRTRGTVDVVFDSTGLKVYGEGEWKVRKHGAGKRRTWKKLHIGIDPSTQDILVAELTDRDGGDAAVAEALLDQIEGSLGTIIGDGAYDSSSFRRAVHCRDADLLVPPPRNAKYKAAEGGWQRKRDESLAEIQGLGGDEEARSLWKKLRGYHQRSLVETTMYRLKQILGGRLRSRCPENQTSESYIKCLIINKLNKLGLPRGKWIEQHA